MWCMICSLIRSCLLERGRQAALAEFRATGCERMTCVLQVSLFGPRFLFVIPQIGTVYMYPCTYLISSFVYLDEACMHIYVCIYIPTCMSACIHTTFLLKIKQTDMYIQTYVHTLRLTQRLLPTYATIP